MDGNVLQGYRSMSITQDRLPKLAKNPDSSEDNPTYIHAFFLGSRKENASWALLVPQV
jgi:hypothetical protein